MWYKDTCTCGCARTDSAAKQFCAQDPSRSWDDKVCGCVCKVREVVTSTVQYSTAVCVCKVREVV